MLAPPRSYVYLDAVARAGSIRKAAEQLHVASTALNRKINEIEDSLGTPLFERLPRGVRLTAAGEVMVAMARRAMADQRAAISHIEHLRGQVRGTVRVGCAESVATDLVPAAIAHYQKGHPGVQFHMASGVTAALVASLLQDAVDLILVHDPHPSDQIKVLASVRQPLCAMVRPDHPLATLAALRLTDCQKYPVALGNQTFGSRHLIDAIVARSSISLKVVLEASTVQALKEFSRTTGAVSFQYQIGTRREVQRGELAAIPLTDRSLAQTRLVLACRAGRMMPIASQSFAQLLELTLSQLTAPHTHTKSASTAELVG
jgi:DNA-binding transcriptional LysR family regulator